MCVESVVAVVLVVVVVVADVVVDHVKDCSLDGESGAIVVMVAGFVGVVVVADAAVVAVEEGVAVVIVAEDWSGAWKSYSHDETAEHVLW